MLTEKAGDRNGQGSLGVVVDDGHGPGKFLPGGEEVEDTDRRDGRAGERQNNSEEHRKHTSAVGIDGLIVFLWDAFNIALDHKRGKRNDPGHIERDQTGQPVGKLKEGGQLILRNNERRAGDDHHPDDQSEEQVPAGETETRQTIGQRRRYESGKHDRDDCYENAVEEVEIKLLLRENVLIVFEGDLAQLREEMRWELIQSSVRTQRGAEHIDHGHDRNGAADQQQKILSRIGKSNMSFFHVSPPLFALILHGLELEEGQNHQCDRHDEGQRCSITELAGTESFVIHPCQHGLRLVHGLSVGNHLDRGEYIKAADSQHNQREKDRRLDAGKCDREELIHAAAAVHLRRFVELVGHRLKRRKEHDQVPADALPDAEQHHHGHATPAGIQPGHILRRQMKHICEQIVEHAFGVEDIAKNERDNDPGGDDRDVVDHAESHPEARNRMDQHRGKKAQDHLPGHSDKGVDQCVFKGDPKGFIRQNCLVIIKSGEALVKHAAQIPSQKAHAKQFNDGINRKESKNQNAGQKQRGELKLVASGSQLHWCTPSLWASCAAGWAAHEEKDCVVFLNLLYCFYCASRASIFAASSSSVF